VDPEAEDQFIDAWRVGHQRIPDQVRGAMGSTLLRPADAPNTEIRRARACGPLALAAEGQHARADTIDITRGG
jgi:hypothetical protein